MICDRPNFRLGAALSEGKSLPTQDKEVPVGGKATEAEAVAEEDRKGKRRRKGN